MKKAELKFFPGTECRDEREVHDTEGFNLGLTVGIIEGLCLIGAVETFVRDFDTLLKCATLAEQRRLVQACMEDRVVEAPFRAFSNKGKDRGKRLSPVAV